MIKGSKKKLNSKKGETLTEVLVALLIGSIALALLATMVGSSVSIISKSETKMTNYYMQNNKLEEKGSDSTSGNATFSVNGTAVKLTDSQAGNDIILKYYQNEQAAKNKPIYSYTK